MAKSKSTASRPRDVKAGTSARKNAGANEHAREGGVNASGGEIEHGQSNRVGRGKSAESQTDWMDETERDTPDRTAMRAEITSSPKPGKKRAR
jgi:hypothetical protein